MRCKPGTSSWFSDPHNGRSWFSRDVRLVLFRAGATVRARAVSRKQQGCIAPPGRMLASAPSQPRSAVPATGSFCAASRLPFAGDGGIASFKGQGSGGRLQGGSTNPRSISKFVSFFLCRLLAELGSGCPVFLLDVPLSRTSRIRGDLIGTWGPLACHMKEHESQLPSADSAMLPPHSGDGTAGARLARNTRPGADGRH